MRTRLAILGGLALALFAEEPSAEARAPAVTLLDRAEASVAAVSPAIQASALLHLADTWYAFDSKKGAALADRAFEASLPLPPDERATIPRGSSNCWRARASTRRWHSPGAYPQRPKEEPRRSPR